MPVNKYFKGHGSEVMSNMKQEYGGKKGESIFYATANKRGMKPGAKPKGKSLGHRMGKLLGKKSKGY